MRIPAGRSGRRFGLKAGKAILEVAKDDLAGHNAPSGQVGIALSKDFKPVGRSGYEMIVHGQRIGEHRLTFQS